MSDSGALAAVCDDGSESADSGADPPPALHSDQTPSHTHCKPKALLCCRILQQRHRFYFESVSVFVESHVVWRNIPLLLLVFTHNLSSCLYQPYTVVSTPPFLFNCKQGLSEGAMATRNVFFSERGMTHEH